MEVFSNAIMKIHDFLWLPIEKLDKVPIIGWLPPLAILLIGTGLWFSIQLGFIQVRGFKSACKKVFGNLSKKTGRADKEGMSSYQALATAIAAQVGTGNIVGASTAIAAGGPGAIFWMWIAAFFGMATIFAEAVLAQKFKIKGDDGQITGGPVYYIKGAFKGKFGKYLALIFAILASLSFGLMGSAVQSNGIATAWDTVFNQGKTMVMVNILGEKVSIIQPIVGVIVAVLAFLIIAGGMTSIASFTEKIVPAMALIFISGSLFTIVTHIAWVPEIFRKIFVGAFAPRAVFGGSVGIAIKDAISKGISRGLFSNEAGMGSTPHAHAVAKVKYPAEQGLVAMIGVFIDTFIVLNLTSFVIIGSGMFDSTIAGKTLTGAELAQAAFGMGFGNNTVGNIFIAICLTFFAFSTIVGWYFFGRANVKYLFGSKVMRIYAFIVCICIFLGSIQGVELIWTMQDTFSGMIVIPNLIAILALTKIVKVLMKEEYE